MQLSSMCFAVCWFCTSWRDFLCWLDRCLFVIARIISACVQVVPISVESGAGTKAFILFFDSRIPVYFRSLPWQRSGQPTTVLSRSRSTWFNLCWRAEFRWLVIPKGWMGWSFLSGGCWAVQTRPLDQRWTGRQRQTKSSPIRCSQSSKLGFDA